MIWNWPRPRADGTLFNKDTIIPWIETFYNPLQVFFSTYPRKSLNFQGTFPHIVPHLFLSGVTYNSCWTSVQPFSTRIYQATETFFTLPSLNKRKFENKKDRNRHPYSFQHQAYFLSIWSCGLKLWAVKERDVNQLVYRCCNFSVALRAGSCKLVAFGYLK